MLRRRDVMGSVAAAIAASAVPLGRSARAEDLPSERVYETRTLLFLDPGAQPLQARLPSGWTSAPAPQGPAAGAGLVLVFIDRLLATDAEGKPATPPSNRLVVLAAPAKAADAEKPVTLILAGVSADPAGAPGFYGVYAPGSIAVERQQGGASPDACEERWTVAAEGGDAVSLELAWTRAAPVFMPFDQLITSGRDPQLRRRYVGDQGAVVLRSASANVDRASRVAATFAGPGFEDLATAKITAVMSLAWYRRATFVLGGA